MSLLWAEEAIQYVRTTVGMRSNNREFDRRLGEGDVVAARIEANSRRQKAPAEWQAELAAEVSAYVDLKAGNCDEMAKVAFVYLAKKGLSPLEVAYFSNADALSTRLFGTTNVEDVEPDHAFVIIGRKLSMSEALERKKGVISIPPVESWNFGAVICDPWSKRAYLAHRLALESEMINRVTAGRTKLCSDIRLEEGEQWHG